MNTTSHQKETEQSEPTISNETIIEQAANKVTRDLKYIIDISGANAQKKSKAHTFIKSYQLYPVDGTERVLAELNFSKPIVKVFHQLGYYHLFLDFGSPNDMDLRMTFDTITRFSSPENSVSWLPDEIESGLYLDENGIQRKVYYPMISITLIPIGKETEYQMTGFNPLLFDLTAGDIKGTPSVMHFVFDENAFEITDQKIEFSMNEVRQEAEEELERELEGKH